MASALTDRLSKLVKTMRGQARITEANVQDMLREVRMALLEADVALPVVRDFVARVKEKALGTEVAGSLNPGQALVGMVHKELAATMGEGVADINLAAQPPAVILMAGLQGAGKTTTTAKLAKHLITKRKKKVLTVSADVYRPAAIEQLKLVTAQAGAEWFPSDPAQKPREIALAALDYAKRHYFDVLLVDTADVLGLIGPSLVNHLPDTPAPMDFLFPDASFALPATVLLLLAWLAMRLRQRQSSQRGAAREALDTVASWPPEAARVLTIAERQAYDLLRRALPGYLVLAQVPLSRFIRVPARHSYVDWLQRVGSLSADLLLCDAGSRVLAVIDIRSPGESERSRRRHERMTRVLRKAGVHVLTWREDALPSAAEVRHAMTAVVGGAAAVAKAAATSSRPMPLIPVADISEVLAEGDRAAFDAQLDPSMEPVPSAFFEELEAEPARR